MSSLAIDQNILVNYARPKLDQAKKYINQARSQANGFNIPSSFYYRGYLQKLANNLLTIENNVQKVNTQINNSITEFNNIERKTTAKTSQISSLISNLNLTSSVSATGTNVSKNINSSTKAESALAKVKSTSKDFLKMLKATGAKVVNGAKSLWNGAKEWYNDNVAGTNLDKMLNMVGKTAAKVGSTISGWAKSAWNWIANTAAPVVWDVLKKTASLIVVTMQSILSGLLQVVEAAVDLVCIVGLGIASIGTGIWDAGQAIYGAITGNEWHSATKAMWKGSMGFIATTHVKNAFGSLNNTAYGRWLNENSFGDWARTDGIYAQIFEGIGYAVGVIALTVATFGTATPLTLGATAGSLAVSKYTEEAWNNNKVTISDGTNNYEMAFTYDELSKLKNGETISKNIEGVDENGNKTTSIIQFIQNSDGSYSALINGQTLSVSIDETGIVEGLIYGGVNGLWEGAQWGVGAAIGGGSFKSVVGGIKNPILNKVTTSGIRVVLDSATGAVEVPFRTILDAGYNDMSLEEAWNKNGGWNGVLSQTVMAALMSTGGEVLDLGKISLSKKFNKNLTSVDLTDVNGTSYKSFNTKADIANYFDDPKMKLLEKAKSLQKNGNLDPNIKTKLNTFLEQPTSDIDINEVYKVLSPFLTVTEQTSIIKSINNFENTNLGKWVSNLSEAEKDAVYCYTKKGGFEINACLNKAEYILDPKTGNKIYGQQVGNEFVRWSDEGALEKITSLIYSANGKNINVHSKNIMNELDSAIGGFKLEEPITVYRGINGFGDNIDMDALAVGQQITTSGYSSCSILSDAASLTKNKDYLLEINIPEGYNGAYIESVSGVKNYGQLEFLLKRNSTIEITDISIGADGKKIIKCDLVPNSSFVNNANIKNISDEVTTELSKITTELGETTVEIFNVTAELTNNNSIVEKIPGTNIDKHYAFEQYKVTDGSVKTYPGTNIPQDKVISDLDTIKTYNGNTVGDKVSTIKNIYGKNSIEAVTAEAQAMEAVINIRDINNASGLSNMRASADYVANKVDEIINLSDKGSNYLQFRTEAECETYFKSDLDYWKDASQQIDGSQLKNTYDSMKAYTGMDSSNMNNMMRDNNISSGISADNIYTLANTLDSFTLKDDMILYRGVDNMDYFLREHGITSSGDIAKDLKALTGGVFTVSDNAFVSTTPVMGKGFTWKKVVEVIKAPAGTKGSYVGTESTVSTECELLLQAGEFNKSIVQAVEEIGDQIFVYVQLLN